MAALLGKGCRCRGTRWWCLLGSISNPVFGGLDAVHRAPEFSEFMAGGGGNPEGLCDLTYAHAKAFASTRTNGGADVYLKKIDSSLCLCCESIMHPLVSKAVTLAVNEAIKRLIPSIIDTICKKLNNVEFPKLETAKKPAAKKAVAKKAVAKKAVAKKK